MRIILSRPSTGVFYSPGLARPVVIDVDNLPQARADKLRDMAEKAVQLASPPAADAASAKGRDLQQFVIDIEDRGQHHRLHFSEPLAELSTALRKFVDLVRSEAELI